MEVLMVVAGRQTIEWLFAYFKDYLKRCPSVFRGCLDVVTWSIGREGSGFWCLWDMFYV